ncbi:MAG: DNA-binding protein [Clostridia bacterium]|nr:DNA-binding protein [Clostridia bacterium]
MPKDLYVSALLDVYGAFLSEKQRTLAGYYYNEDLSLSEIAENEGITRQGVNDLIKRTEAELRGWEDECHYCERILRLKELAEQSRNSAQTVPAEMLDLIEKL